MKHPTTRRFAACLLVAVAMLPGIASISAMDIKNLRGEYRAKPLGIDAAKPRLSWVIADFKSEFSNSRADIPRGLRQTAYQVLVAKARYVRAANRETSGSKRMGKSPGWETEPGSL